MPRRAASAPPRETVMCILGRRHCGAVVGWWAVCGSPDLTLLFFIFTLFRLERADIGDVANWRQRYPLFRLALDGDEFGLGLGDWIGLGQGLG